jgi:hypothetical protein
MSKVDDYLRDRAAMDAMFAAEEKERRDAFRHRTLIGERAVPPVEIKAPLDGVCGPVGVSIAIADEAYWLRQKAEALVDWAHPEVGDNYLSATLERYVVWRMTGWDTQKMRRVLVECFLEDVGRWVDSVRSGEQDGGRPFGYLSDGQLEHELRQVYLYWRRLPSFETFQPVDNDGKPIPGAAEHVKVSARFVISDRRVECGQLRKERETCCEFHKAHHTGFPDGSPQRLEWEKKPW